MILSQLIFAFILAGVSYVAVAQFKKVYHNIMLGKSETISGNYATRVKNVLLVAFGQKKMFSRIIPGVLHFFIYSAFLLTQIELLEIIIDGISGSHRFFLAYLGGFYSFLLNFIEFLSLLAFVATVIFLWRRNVLKIPRFVKNEMKGWPTLDANFILIGEILLLIGIFTMNGADIMLQGLDPNHFTETGYLFVSSNLGPALFGGFGIETLHLMERCGWWLHIMVVFGFIIYLPYSKHLHIFLAFPNVYFTKLKPRGELENMPVIMNEVKSMMGIAIEEANTSVEIPEFGSKDINDLSWKNILEAYTCTECGSCTSVCPANMTGKKLSPRKIMMDIRDRTEEFSLHLNAGDAQYFGGDEEAAKNKDLSKFSDGKSLFDYITKEELYACTSCNACVEACPVLINPLEPIIAMRRYDILSASAGPSDWLPMFNSIENTGSVWQLSEDRDAWTKD